MITKNNIFQALEISLLFTVVGTIITALLYLDIAFILGMLHLMAGHAVLTIIFTVFSFLNFGWMSLLFSLPQMMAFFLGILAGIGNITGLSFLAGMAASIAGMSLGLQALIVGLLLVASVLAVALIITGVVVGTMAVVALAQHFHLGSKLVKALAFIGMVVAIICLAMIFGILYTIGSIERLSRNHPAFGIPFSSLTLGLIVGLAVFGAVMLSGGAGLGFLAALPMVAGLISLPLLAQAAIIGAVALVVTTLAAAVIIGSSYGVVKYKRNEEEVAAELAPNETVTAKFCQLVALPVGALHRACNARISGEVVVEADGEVASSHSSSIV